MSLELHLLVDLDLHLVNNFYLFSKFCLVYSLLLFYTILWCITITCMCITAVTLAYIQLYVLNFTFYLSKTIKRSNMIK